MICIALVAFCDPKNSISYKWSSALPKYRDKRTPTLNTTVVCCAPKKEWMGGNVWIFGTWGIFLIWKLSRLNWKNVARPKNGRILTLCSLDSFLFWNLALFGKFYLSDAGLIITSRHFFLLPTALLFWSKFHLRRSAKAWFQLWSSKLVLNFI